MTARMLRMLSTADRRISARNWERNSMWWANRLREDSLMDVQDFRATLREARRVCRPGGSGEFVILHPEFVDRDDSALFEAKRNAVVAPASEWAAWVRISQDQPESTLYFHRSTHTYLHAF